MISHDLQCALQQRIEHGGRAWLATTVLHGRRALRININGILTQQQHRRTGRPAPRPRNGRRRREPAAQSGIATPRRHTDLKVDGLPGARNKGIPGPGPVPIHQRQWACQKALATIPDIATMPYAGREGECRTRSSQPAVRCAVTSEIGFGRGGAEQG